MHHLGDLVEIAADYLAILPNMVCQSIDVADVPQVEVFSVKSKLLLHIVIELKRHHFHPLTNGCLLEVNKLILTGRVDKCHRANVR